MKVETASKRGCILAVLVAARVTAPHYVFIVINSIIYKRQILVIMETATSRHF